MKTIKGDLILTKDTIFEESIKVEGNIIGYFNLKVVGNIDARNIDVGDINAWDINAGDINADFVVCEERKLKSKTSKTICKNLVTKRSTYEKKETEVKQ